MRGQASGLRQGYGGSLGYRQSQTMADRGAASDKDEEWDGLLSSMTRAGGESEQGSTADWDSQVERTA